MAAKKKEPKPAFAETETFRSPLPLPPFVPTGDAEVDEGFAALRESGSVPPSMIEAIARLGTEAQVKSVAELLREALDLGVPAGLGHGATAPDPGVDLTSPKAKKAYERFFDTIYGNQRKRLQYLTVLMHLLARHAAGERRLLEVVTDRGVEMEARQLAAAALVGFEWVYPAWRLNTQRPREILVALAALLETTPELGTQGTYALFAVDPERFAERLTAHLASDPPDSLRTYAILTALYNPAMPLEGWADHAPLADALAPLLRAGKIPAAVDIAAKMTGTPSLVDAAVVYADGFFARYPTEKLGGPLHTLLVRHPDRRAASYLARGISFDVKSSTESLDALRNLDEPSAAPALRESIKTHEKSLKKYAADVLAKAREVLAHLERNETSELHQLRGPMKPPVGGIDRKS